MNVSPIVLKKYFAALACSLLLGLLCAPMQLNAQGWDKIFGEFYSEARLALTAHDGNILISGDAVGGLANNPDLNDASLTYLLKMNPAGDRIWQKAYTSATAGITELQQSPDQTYVGHRKDFLDVAGSDVRKAVFFKLDEDGNPIWELILEENASFYSEANEMLINADGSIAFLGELGDGTTSYFGLISSAGELLQFNELGTVTIGDELIAQSSGGYFYKTFQNFQYLEFIELDATGNSLSSQSYPTITGNTKSTSLLSNGDWVLFERVGAGPTDQVRINTATGAINRQQVLEEAGNETGIQELALADGFLLVGARFNALPGANGSLMVRTDLDGNVLWRQVHAHLPGGQLAYSATPLNDGGFVVAGNFDSFVSGFLSSHVFRTNANGEIYTNSLAGTVAIDVTSNCLFDAGETPLEDWAITAQKGEQQFFAMSDDEGSYVLPLDTGNFIINIYPPSNLWLPCANEIPIDISTFNNQISLDFPITIETLCPGMSVSHTVPAIRPCFERPSYINYCNNGTDTAFAAYVDITYDSLITPMSSTIPWVEITENVYRFEVGDLAPLECGKFQVGLFLDCEATVGASFCIDAHAFPDTLCAVDSSAWSGAFLEASGYCDQDNVYLRLENIGEQDMGEYSNYIIVEDILFFGLDSVNLQSGEIIDIPIPANGSTFTLLAEQIAEAPGFSHPIAIVEGCGENDVGEFSVGFANQFALDDAAPFLDADCPIAVSSFDPNDKQGFPIGYLEPHYILPETTIEYLIRFQNTGTDTAFTVVIRDTLDSNFNIATFSAGASSHDYDVEMEGQGILKFTFQNILLPDSIVDLQGSNGFVEFNIAPKVSTPLGTVIRNKSAIYFDFNEPVITNETYHTLGEEFIEVEPNFTSHPILSNIKVSVRPNPFVEQALLEVINHSSESYLIEIYNMQGQLIRKEKHRNNQIILTKKGLSSGVYLYRITADDGFLHSGSILVR